MTKKSLVMRFWEKVERRGPDECWEWRAQRTRGYGRFKVQDTSCYAHRVAWELAYGPIPKGLCVLHSCDTPSCVNPAHLFLGTQFDNTKDREAKGRGAKGERHGQAKLTEKQVRRIRREYARGTVSESALARRYKVHRSLIGYIVRGRVWKHVEFRP